MIKKIIILGSTGSVGKSTLNIIRNNKKKFKIILLSTNKNVNELVKQAKEFKVKNIIIFNKKKYDENKLRLLKQNKIKVYNNLKSFYQKKKIKKDFIISAISGLNGLEPTLTSIKYTKRIAIANKESLICAWNLIQKKLKFHKTEFFSIYGQVHVPAIMGSKLWWNWLFDLFRFLFE